jgi:type IV pilus assembly protein PilP
LRNLIIAFALVFSAHFGFAQNDKSKSSASVGAPTNDVPPLIELPPADAKPQLSRASTSGALGPDKKNPEGEKTESLFQTYSKPEPTADGYIYDPVGRRDPFRPFRDAKVGIGQIVVTRERPLEPLENFDVKSLEVVAIIWGIKKPKALIQDSTKVIHTVVKGMRIGKNDGVVAEIREGEVVVMELFDQNGKIVKEPFILPIKK